MDIMNNMTVSISKLTFSLIAISALLISGSAIMVQEASAGVPTFTAYHNSTTSTILWFSEPINGTLLVADWDITLTDNANPELATHITISDIYNGTKITSAADVILNNSHFANNTQGPIILVHGVIPSDATYYVNYTTYDAAFRDTGFSGNIVDAVSQTENAQASMAIGTDTVASDFQHPTVVSAELLKSNPSQVKVTMSEIINNYNYTTQTEYQNFSIITSGGGNEIKVASIEAGNSTKDLYINLVNPALATQTLSFALQDNGISHNWITDAQNSEIRINVTGAPNAYGPNEIGYGIQLLNITSFDIVNYLTIGMYGEVNTCYDCLAPTVTKVEVSLDSSTPITVTDDNSVQINAGLGDTVSVMVTVDDNMGADSIPFAGIYTNFGETPDNLYYANNFDSFKQMSTSYYEWNARTADVAFGNTDAITWNEVTAQINPDRTQTITYTMTINDEIELSQVWIDLGDNSGNYAKSVLPITLEVSGSPAITFASDDSQKVVSFFNESILLAIVSQWTATSSDDASNVEQLSSVLGIESQLPTWTTELASWVADDKIDVADMIVAVEYVINQ
jgi:hypothetical protein